ncbi:MAG: efflux RND transporter periplasmic adaptor subunit [Bacteroidetes bacterium]|nr:efflux RND transporter periplasmic adaptor subunit [Bacteroidota bacterium]
MKNHLTILLSLLLVIASSSCKQKTETEFGNELGKTDSKADPIHVEGEIATFGDFPLEFVSNGKLNASSQAELYFKKNQLIENINVKNGDWIEGGTVLATMENQLDLINLDQAEIRLESANIERENQVIGHTANQKGKLDENDQAMNYFSLSSGFREAELNMKKAQLDYQNTILTAPFSGRVIDLDTKIQNLPTSGEPFCRLINDRVFEVIFPILESEIGRLKVGQSISMRPFIADSVFYRGKISEINPAVDEHGLVKVTALVPNSDGELLQGMNVKVFIKDKVSNCVIVPKEAVVLRNNQQVVFKYSEGKAMWNYVGTVHENSTHYSVIPVKAGQEILEGDTIITIGNLNLAHEAEVKFRMSNK